jgi:transposase InsO family protein
VSFPFYTTIFFNTMAYIDLSKRRPYGRYYIPCEPPPDKLKPERRAGIVPFNDGIEAAWVQRQRDQPTNQLLLQSDRDHALRHLRDPHGELLGATKKERAYDSTLRHKYRKNLEEDGGQLYWKSNGQFDRRAALTASNAYAIHTQGHRWAGHQGVRKVWEFLREFYHPVTYEDCEFFKENCLICSLNEKNQYLPKSSKIVSHGCLHRIQIDLMDFKLTPDGDTKYILQVKDHFSRMVWLFPLEDKEAEPVTTIMEVWFDDNGYPVILQMDNGTEFKARLIKVLEERGIIIINGRPRNPQAQGSVEVANRSFKAVLRKYQVEFGTSKFVMFLKPIQLILNTSQTAELPDRKTPFDVWFGRKPGFIRPKINEIFDGDTNETRMEATNDLEADGFQWVDFREDDIEYERRVLTEAENRVHQHNAHRATRYGKNNPVAPSFAIGDLVTLVVHLRQRLSNESTRLPCRITVQ